MMENKIILAINSGEGKTRLLTADTGKAVNVQLIPGNKYLLKKVNDDFAPENITIKRVGKALHIIQEGDTLPSIIIDDYFNDDPNKPVLLGMAEDGQLYAYAPLSGESYDTGYLIADGNMSPVALGGESVGPGRDIFTATGDNDDSLFGLLGFLAAASAIGVGAAVAMNEGSDDIADHNAPETPAIGETIDNEGAIVGPLKSGDHTDDTTPTLSGRGEPGDTIHIYDKGKEIGSVKVGDDGKWNYTPEKPLDEGEHELTVTEEDPSGNESKPSAPIVINVDTLAPAAPAIQHVIDKVGNVVGEISHNGWTDDTRPEMSGTGEAGATITIYDNGKAIGQTDVNADGRWYFKPTQDLADGNHNFTVTQTDKAGNISEPSNPIQIVVDTVPPVKPDVVNALDDSDPFTGMIQDGGVTNDSRPTFSGGGEPGDTVTLYDGDKVLGTIVIGDDGKWLFAPDEPLTDGDHSFTVTQTDPTGNTSKPSDSLDFAVDTTPPNAGEDVLRITGVADNVGDYQGNVASGDITDDSQPAITGIGEAGNTVFVFSTDAAGRHLIGSAVVDADGTWSLTPDAPLLEGLNSLTLETQDLAGNRIAGEAPSWDITLLIPTGAEPSIISVNDDSEPYVGPLQKGEVTNDSTPTVNGTAAAGDIITIRDGSTILGSVTADSNGRWIFTPDSALADGNHDFTVTATDPAGNRKESGSFPVVIDTTAPSVIADLLIMDNVGEYTGPVNDGDTTDDQSPTFSGTAQAGDIITVFDNGVVLGSAIASDDGKWTYTPETPLVKGKHEITTTVTDPAGNTSEPSPGISFTVDPDPNMVTLGAVKDDQGPVTGSLTDGSVTDDARPELTGSGKPGSVVTIKDGDEVLGSTTVKQDGRWSFTPAGDLADGDHSLMVISVDQAGNDVVSPAFDLTVDTAPPGKPAIAVANDDVGDIRGDLASDSVTDDANPTLKGIAEAGSRVDIYDNGELIGSAVADSNGTWSFTPTTPLPEGGHHLIVTATDRAGNTGPASDRFVLSTDYTPPDSSKVSITSVVDDAGSVTGNMTSGSVTDDNTPLIKGTGAEPGNTITVYNGNTVIGTATVQGDGTWSLQVNTALADGTYRLTAKETDKVGNETSASPEYVIQIDAGGQPLPPTLTSVVDDVATYTGALQSNAITNDNTLTLTGTAEANVTVKIYGGANGTTLLGSTTADANGDWTYTTPALSDGLHTFVAEAVNSIGQVSPQTGGFPVTVDTAAPGAVSDVVVTDDQAPQVGNLSDGDTTNDATPKISGIAEPGSVVHIYVDGVENGSTTADASGNWTYTTTSLADGQHTFTARVEDTAGNLGPVNAGITVMLDTSTVTVSITSVKDDVGAVTGNIAANMVTDDARPEITGKAKAGSIVTIKDGSMVLGSITAGADGTWTFTPVTNLGDGAHSITATAKDLSGQEDTSGAFTFRVDTVAPNRPMIDYAEDQVGAVKNDLSNNGYTDDPQPILHGTAEANSIVNIYTLDGTLIGSATASSSGAWNFKPGSKLPEGKNTFYVTSTDAAGNVSDKSANFVVNTDYTSPDASKVSIDTVTDQYGNVQGPVLSGGVLDDPRPVIGGTGAEQGNVITVYTTDKDGNTRVLGSATVDANGRWTMTPSGSLYADSINRLSVVETDSVGNEAKPSGTYDVTLSNPPTSPVIDGVTDDSGSANVELNNRGVTSDTTPTLHGTAPGVAGNIVTIYNGNQIVGSTTLDASGHWTFTPQPALTDGTYDFTVTVKNTAGQESAKSPSFGIEIDATAPGAATDLTITDDVGTITGPLNNNDITDDNKPTFAGKAEPNSIVTILDNDTAIGSATVDKFGNWSWTPTTALADGAHQFTTTVTDSVGNTGAPTSPVNITVDTQAPGITLAIDGYLDDVGTNKGVITASGTSTDDTSPVLRGSWTGDLGSVEYIRIYQDGIFLGNATLDRGQHTWTLDVSGLENTKTYQFTATAVDAAGSESSPTPAFALTIDLDPPTQTVTITSYTDDVGLDTGNMGPNTSTDDRQPVLNGKIVGTALDAGDEVRIYDADSNTLLGTATVTGDSWSFELPALNDNTTYNFRAVVSDSAGNEGTTSGNFRITVDLNVVVNDQDTLDTTPIISGYTGFEIQPGEYVEVTVNGNTYSSQNGQVVVDPLNNTWYVQIPATHRLTTGTYDVQAVLYSAEGVRITNDDTTRELTISSAPRITFSSTTATSDDTGTAITIGEDGTWRILSNSTIFTQDGTSSSTLGSFSSVALSGPDRQQQSTFIDFDRDGLMDVLGADTSYANGQQSFKYNGSQYSVFQLGAYGVSGETNDANGNAYVWYGGAAGIDINGDGFVDIVYGDETPNDAEARGGYDTTFVINTNGTILGFNKSDAYVYSGSSQDGVAPANEDNPTPDREIAGVDLNNDGYVDIVYHGTSGTNETQAGGTNGSSSRLVVVTNGVNSSGKTTLTNTEIITGVWSGDQATTNRYTSLNWSDLNGDGYMDLFIGGLTTVGSGGATSTIHYNDGTGKFTTAANGVGTGASVQSLGDTVNSMTSLSVDWNGDGRMDVIEIAGMAGSTALNNASNVGLLWLNGGNNASQQVTWTSQTLLTNANLSSTYITTGALAVDLDYDNDQDLVVFRAEGGTTAYIENTSTVQDGTSITVRLLDAQGINSFYGNTVMLIDEATGKVVSSQIINAQSGVNMNNSTGLVYFYGLDANASYSVVLLANGKDYGGVGSITLNTGTNTIENVASSWSGLRAKEANNAYVLTAESDPNAMNSATAASDGSNTVGILGTGYNDTLFATAGSHIYNGGGGSTTVSGVKSWSNTVGLDIVDYKLAGNAALTIDLNRTTTQSTGFGSARFVDVEGLAGGQGNDTFTGNASNNYFEGRGGNDIFNLDVDQKGGGQDTLAYQAQAGGNSNGTGGNGSDTVHGFRVGTIEATLSADAIDVSNLLVGYSASADGAAHYINGVATIDAGETIGQFLTVAYNGKDTVVSIDRDGSGGAYSSSTLLTLADTKADLATLLANHQLILTDEGSAGIANFSALSEGMTANLWTGFNSAGEQLENITTLISTSGDDVITDNSADNVLEGGAGDDTFYLMNGGNDTLMYKVLDGMGNDSTGGNGHDVVHCFNVGNVGNVATDSDADTLNLSDLLDHSGPISFFENNGRTELDAASKGLENYLKTEVVGNDTVISIDRDGQGGQHGFTQVVTLADVQTDLVTLLQNNQITI